MNTHTICIISVASDDADADADARTEIETEEEEVEGAGPRPLPDHGSRALQEARCLLYRVALGHESPALLRQLAARHLADTMSPADIRQVFGIEPGGGRRGSRAPQRRSDEAREPLWFIA